MSFRFYLGTHIPSWLWKFPDVEFFVSDTRLRGVGRLHPALSPWALDSGGFSELGKHGTWTISAADYAERIERFSSDIGRLLWAAPQDWMCEPIMLQKTRLTVEDHQEKTIDSVLQLRELVSSVNVIPVLQGWHPDDYFRHRDRYHQRGVDLVIESVVGVGSVCRRQSSVQISAVLAVLGEELNLHAFGFKKTGLLGNLRHLVSADSMAWSFDARYKPPLPECSDSGHKNCANCFRFAKRWLDNLTEECAL